MRSPDAAWSLLEAGGPDEVTIRAVARAVNVSHAAPRHHFAGRSALIEAMIVEGFGFHIPKGYLYAAIGFSVLIEAANQVGRHNRDKRVTSMDLRDRTAGAVLRLLGGGRSGDASHHSDALDVIAEQTAAGEVFHPEEKEMIRGVLDLVGGAAEHLGQTGRNNKSPRMTWGICL